MIRSLVKYLVMLYLSYIQAAAPVQVSAYWKLLPNKGGALELQAMRKKMPPGTSFCPACGTLNTNLTSETEASVHRNSNSGLHNQKPGRSDEKKTSGWAIAALVTGILSLLCCPIIGSILAIVFSRIAKNEIADSDGKLKGHNIAKGGLALGIISLIAPFILLLIALPIAHYYVFPQLEARYNLVNGVYAVEYYYDYNGGSYNGETAAELSKLNDETEYSNASSEKPDVVYVEDTGEESVKLYTYSKTGTKYTVTIDEEYWDFNFNMTNGEYDSWEEFKSWYPFSPY